MSVLVLSESENEGEQLLDELEDDASVEAVVEMRVSDERANIPVSVVTERFLRAIVEKVPLDRIEELHLFSPLRQGTIETGIAVVAARVIVVDDVVVLAPLELQLGAEKAEESNGAQEAVQAGEVVEAIKATEAEAVTEIIDVEHAPDSENLVETEHVNVDDVEVELEEAVSEDIERAAHDDSPYADEPVQLKLVPSSEYPERKNNDDAAALVMVPEVIAAESHEPRIRHTVYTARYRLIVKGPERGKWEMDVVDEADAPLLAVETVVRGVQRRAGEETATVRYDASQLARVLRMPLPE